jgi:photosystem II stability/assembly factor-like uncharacterized protein
MSLIAIRALLTSAAALLFLFFAVGAHAAAPNASPLGSSNGLFVTRDAAGTDIPLASIDGALFRLSADGRTATNLVLGINDTRINTWALEATPFNNVIYAGTPNTGVWRTGDGGTTWVQRNTGLGTCLNITSYGVATATRHLLTTRCNDIDSIWVSADAGQSWTRRFDFAAGVRVYRFTGSLSTNARSIARTTRGLWTSEDEGLTWLQVAQVPRGLDGLRTIPLDADVPEFTSINNTTVNNPQIVVVQGVGPFYTANAYASSRDVYTFNLLTAGLPSGAVFGRRVSVVNERFYLPVRDVGLFRLNAAGNAWELAISEQAVPGIDRVFQFNQDPRIWFAQSRTSGIWRSTDGGTTWTRWGVTNVVVSPSATGAGGGQTFSIAAGNVPEAAVQVSTVGPITQRTVTVQLDTTLLPVPQSAGGYQVYVIALLPTATPLIFLKGPDPAPQDWGPVTNPLRAFIRNVSLGSQDQRVIIEIVKDTDLSLLVGAEFYIGYGRDDADLLASRRYRGVYKIAP